jgi:hypothetical protein
VSEPAAASVIRLEQWFVSMTGDRYTAPENRVPYLTGCVYGHPNFADGDKVSTSEITATKGRTITTSSGRTYRLGKPDPGYVAWLAEQGKTLNPRKPVTLTVRPTTKKRPTPK